MTSSNVHYHEDYYTLRGMTDHFELSIELIREIQKHGLMLPEIVKFGSEEIEIYSTLDRNTYRHVTEAMEKYEGLSQAIVAARTHIAQVYRVAHEGEPTHVDGSTELGQLPLRIQRRKLYSIHQLLEALDTSEERYHQILHHIKIEPIQLLIPGEAIEYYLEDDYLRLRYILTLLSQGCPLETAADVAYDWGMRELW